ncbi:hypothetical protein C5Y96_05785 [Blastopirellula marina]|uniref:Helix-turn-helix domain-containing protein n=1 Tax=Blastopirellula marina TaxID=124 RepID=A0A2S8G5D6_9BACT|nr:MULTISPECIES: hypothetical protein [Pirellulaceae]PQO39364.1 hypothetical protein C5Y96_05785 [Blastopirellula marina]RCS55672.1 hypothetical protein DTL36_05795 [Bremerella cremea]
MSTAVKERTWDDWSQDSHRLRTLKQSLLVASAAEGMPRHWFTVREFAEHFRETVGIIHERTALRYLVTLEQSGVLEVKRQRIGKSTVRFRWAGWPPPIR